MSEVVLVLNLKRRSGVLAAAVAAVHRVGLEFQSQRMAEADGRPQLHLVAEGEVGSMDRLEAAFTEIGGVESLADVRVDGQSLLHAPPEPEPDPEPEPERRPDPDPTPDPTPDPVREPEPEPDPVEEPESDPPPVRAEETVSSPASDASRPPATAELKPSMVRRRRRRR